MEASCTSRGVDRNLKHAWQAGSLQLSTRLHRPASPGSIYAGNQYTRAPNSTILTRLSANLLRCRPPQRSAYSTTLHFDLVTAACCLSCRLCKNYRSRQVLMYAVKLERAAGSSSSLLTDAEPRPESSGAGAEPARASTAELQPDAISVTAGNPSVEHLTGIVHLYRCLSPELTGRRQSSQDRAEAGNSASVLPVRTQAIPRLCALIPF